MKIVAAMALSVVIVLLGIQASVFYKRNATLKNNLAQIAEELAAREQEYRALQADYEYYKNPINLEKELRSRFNYRLPDEKMMIIVPASSSANSSTQQ